nr:radical SAM protein [Candidatus Sigynarchaeota archaeon]
MQQAQQHGNLKTLLHALDPNLARVFLPFAMRHPSKFLAYGRLAHAYTKSEQIRQRESRDGLVVPPFLILSITASCNLKCIGCYATAVGTVRSRESGNDCHGKNLDFEQWHHVIQQARDLGVFGFILAGGEPFLFPRLLNMCAEFPDRIFIIFTNGTALKEEDFSRFRRLPNVVVIVSIEGNQDVTDQRRGAGVYEKIINTIKRLHGLNVLSGISVTITRNNYKYWMNSSSIDALLADGIHLGFFIEYIPADHVPGELNVLSNTERADFRAKMLDYRATKPIYIIHSPGDEELLGGCVSAGRGFAHVTPSGDLTPCPVSNITTHNLTLVSLRAGLESPLFQQIRESEHILETGGTPCALFAHPDEVAMLMKKVGAHRTNT